MVDGARRLEEALAKLPVFRGVVWRGAGFELTTPVTLHVPLPTSKDVRVASENFRAPVLHAIVSGSGREVGPLSRHPAEAEVALLPGTVLTPATGVHVIEGFRVQVVREVLPSGDSAPQVSDEDLAPLLMAARLASPVEITSPGRFFVD